MGETKPLYHPQSYGKCTMGQMSPLRVLEFSLSNGLVPSMGPRSLQTLPAWKEDPLTLCEKM